MDITSALLVEMNDSLELILTELKQLNKELADKNKAKKLIDECRDIIRGEMNGTERISDKTVGAAKKNCRQSRRASDQPEEKQ